MNKAVLIFPHQLFEDHPSIQKNSPIYLIEEFLFFKQYKFHKQKLVFHRSSMKFYQDSLERKDNVLSAAENYLKTISNL
jgi:deoxyribodipyrimidine photolyase-related protein